jgi:hypothetical protein
MDTYQLNFLGLMGLCAALFLAQGRSKKEEIKGSKPSQNTKNTDSSSQWAFFVVYSLVMGADWLQVKNTSRK